MLEKSIDSTNNNSNNNNNNNSNNSNNNNNNNSTELSSSRCRDEIDMEWDDSGGEGAAADDGTCKDGGNDIKEAGHEDEDEDVDGFEEIQGEDLTTFPSLLDTQCERLDEGGYLRPTTLSVGDVWSKTSYAGLLSKKNTQDMYSSIQEEEKNRTFDLLDALSKSGVLALESAELHVVVVSTHCFASMLVDTLVVDNQNPIEKVEHSTLIVAATVHKTTTEELIRDNDVNRIKENSPQLFSLE